MYVCGFQDTAFKINTINPLKITERERERERKLGVIVRVTTMGRGESEQYFRFEGYQALPASPSDFKAILILNNI
jgi:hypothetical protein